MVGVISGVMADNVVVAFDFIIGVVLMVLYRNKWVQSITVSDVMESGQVVENPMIGAIPSRNEVQRELDDLLMSM